MSVFRHPPYGIGAQSVETKSSEWYHDILQFNQVREKVKNIVGKVCIIDDTALTDNKTLNDSVDEVWDFTGEDGISGHHGHHVGGIIACSKHGYFPKTRIMYAKALSVNSGVGFGVWIADAIRQAMASGYNVINASLGSDKPDSAMKKAVREFCSNGGIFVCAAGNDGRDTDFPAAWANEIPGVISVGSFEKAGDNYKVATYSSSGVVSFVFPGTKITSTLPGNMYGDLTGTSMATPFMAGLVATARALVPHLSFNQFMEAAKGYTIDIEAGKNLKQGSGMIKVLDLLNYIEIEAFEVQKPKRSSCLAFIKRMFKN